MSGVEEILTSIENGEYARTSRDFGRGMAHAAKLIRAALNPNESDAADGVERTSTPGAENGTARSDGHPLQ